MKIMYIIKIVCVFKLKSNNGHMNDVVKKVLNVRI